MPTSERLRRLWDRRAAGYDAMMAQAEQRWFPNSRQWVASRALGEVLEVAVGSGLNLAHYPPGVRISGIEWSPKMLQLARQRAASSGLDADLSVGDAMNLPYPEARFDTVTCTFSLCCIPDEQVALAEMLRVLRPGGRLLLADHVIAESALLRGVQRLVDLVSVPLEGEHFCRRPLLLLDRLPVTLNDTERHFHGAIEHVYATRLDG